jgi:lipoyl synthase
MYVLKDQKSIVSRLRLPDWIRVKTYAGEGRKKVQGVISKLGLHTVCESARCPNLGECWHKKAATFMILGDICTRNCRFCAVKHGEPNSPDLSEPSKIADAVKTIGFKYVVITSVTRDDLEDGGAEHFAKVIQQIRKVTPESIHFSQLNRKAFCSPKPLSGETMTKVLQNQKTEHSPSCNKDRLVHNSDDIKIEVLTPDFNGDTLALRTVLDANPTVFNHNIETVKRLSSEIRTTATYEKSLNFLRDAFSISDGRIPIKSGFMVGVGEDNKEVETTIIDLRDAGVSMLTIGQYLPPSSNHWPLERYVHPDIFEKWRHFALSLGFTNVASAPLVRSSYHAEALAGQ